MTQREKLLERFLEMPKDFTWREVVRLLKQHGYEVQPNSGTSHRAFEHKVTKAVIQLPKPHGKRKHILKSYLLNIKSKLIPEENET